MKHFVYIQIRSEHACIPHGQLGFKETYKDYVQEHNRYTCYISAFMPKYACTATFVHNKKDLSRTCICEIGNATMNACMVEKMSKGVFLSY